MKKCFTYAPSSKISPNGDMKFSDSSRVELTNVKNTAFVMIEGLGTNSADQCKMFTDTQKNVYFHTVPYGTYGLLKDTVALRENARKIKTRGSSRMSHARIFVLQKVVKKYLLLENIEKVYVVAISHGSLIAHSVVLKLQMDIDLSIDQIKKLHVYTIGSPRYLPANLLGGDEMSTTRVQRNEGSFPRLLNFYHVKDPFLPALRRIPFCGFKVPDNVSIATGDHRYIPGDALVFVNRENIIEDDIPLKLDTINNYYMPYDKSFVMSLNAFQKFHGSPYILYPVFDMLIMYHIAEGNRTGTMYHQDTNSEVSKKAIFSLCE